MKKEAILLGGLGYGDEGKGSIVDYLTRIKKAGVVVRYNGGAQAGHTVVTPEGSHHTFSQFGSGTFVPGVKTHLSRFMVLNPLGMMREEEHLQDVGINDAFCRTTIEERALVTTPFQIAVNRLLETWRGSKKHGSCGIGIGQTVEDYLKYRDKVLFAKDLEKPEITAKKLEFLREKSCEAVRDIISDFPQTETVRKELQWLEDEYAVDDLTKDFYYFSNLVTIVDQNHFAELIKNTQTLVFEGAQGIILDRRYGFHPHITKTDITFANAFTLLEESGYQGKITRVGVIRGYATRHGAGPFPTEDKTLTEILKDNHNPYNQWQGGLRIGWLDLPLTKYAIRSIGGVDYIALTNLDRLSGLKTIKVRTNSGFLELSDWRKHTDFLQSEDGLNVPIGILSFGPTWKEKILVNQKAA